MGNCLSSRKNSDTENNTKKFKELINKLYNVTWRKRNVEAQFKQFVQDVGNKQELKKSYNLTLQSSADLSKFCNGIRYVRGDGNCFYTAFGFQYLHTLLMKYDDKQFREFFEKFKDVEMKIYAQEFKIEDKNTEVELLQYFFRRLQILRNIQKLNQREQQFTKEFQNYEDDQDTDCCLYGLSTIFFRNLANKAIEDHQMAQMVYDRENLLQWEIECNNNEIVIISLAKSLQIKISLVFFENKEFQLREYENQNENQIILLIQPGHYNIGLFLMDKQN